MNTARNSKYVPAPWLFGAAGLLALGWSLTSPAAPLSAPAAQAPRILIVQSAEGGPYAEFSAAFRTVLGQSNPARAAGIQITVLDPKNPQNWNGLQAPDLMIAVGTDATQAALGHHGAAPLLSVLIPKLAYKDLTAHGNDPHVTAIYLDQPPGRYLALCRAVVPGLKTLGVLFGPRSAKQAKSLQRAAQAQRLNLATASLSGADNSDPVPALSALLRDSGAILALPDPAVYNAYSVPPLLLDTFRYRVPMIGFSAALVRAGAVAAVYSSPEQIGQQAAELVQAGPLPEGGMYPRYYQTSFNAAVLQALDLPPPDPAAVDRALQHTGVPR